MVIVKSIGAKTVMLVLASFFSIMSVLAQGVDEVTLTVSGEGATKADATALALRSAIEQSYGVFVSANTSILNDELVKDEIATVSSGNIKNYEEILSERLPNGNTVVSLKTTVSVARLISYAQKNGASSVELAGATFGMNARLRQMNADNEQKIISNLITQLRTLYTSLFKYELKLGEPTKPMMPNLHSFYLINADVTIKWDPNVIMFNDILHKMLSAISLSETERQEYDRLNENYYPVLFRRARRFRDFMEMLGDDHYRLNVFREAPDDHIYYLRTTAINQFRNELQILNCHALNFELTDNNQNRFYFSMAKASDNSKIPNRKDVDALSCAKGEQKHVLLWLHDNSKASEGAVLIIPQGDFAINNFSIEAPLFFLDDSRESPYRGDVFFWHLPTYFYEGIKVQEQNNERRNTSNRSRAQLDAEARFAEFEHKARQTRSEAEGYIPPSLPRQESKEWSRNVHIELLVPIDDIANITNIEAKSVSGFRAPKRP